jgi:hypothetical protein
MAFNLGGIVSQLGNMAQSREARQAANQQQTIELMKAGFQPSQDPNAIETGVDKGLMEKLSGMFRTPQRLDPSSFVAAPYHPGNVNRYATDKDIDKTEITTRSSEDIAKMYNQNRVEIARIASGDVKYDVDARTRSAILRDDNERLIVELRIQAGKDLEILSRESGRQIANINIQGNKDLQILRDKVSNRELDIREMSATETAAQGWAQIEDASEVAAFNAALQQIQIESDLLRLELDSKKNRYWGFFKDGTIVTLDTQTGEIKQQDASGAAEQRRLSEAYRILATIGSIAESARSEEEETLLASAIKMIGPRMEGGAGGDEALDQDMGVGSQGWRPGDVGPTLEKPKPVIPQSEQAMGNLRQRIQEMVMPGARASAPVELFGDESASLLEDPRGVMEEMLRRLRFKRPN